MPAIEKAGATPETGLKGWEIMKYDFKKAKRFIEENKENIEEACLGMHEDWFWTAAYIFSNGKFLLNLEQKDLKIGGIDGSYWATPVLQIKYKDGKIKTYHCHDDGLQGEIPVHARSLLDGALTKEVQKARKKLKLEEIK